MGPIFDDGDIKALGWLLVIALLLMLGVGVVLGKWLF